LVAEVKQTDPTRPVIENDWVEPDPARVFTGDVLTAHWYGGLHTDYLDKIEGSCDRWSAEDQPLLVTEFGDWGLPDMPDLAAPPFWDTRAIYAAGLAATLWPGGIARFLTETQRYQGLSTVFRPRCSGAATTSAGTASPSSPTCPTSSTACSTCIAGPSGSPWPR
jgi:hypothetical protein